MSVEEHQARRHVLEEHCREAGRDPSEIEVTHNTRVVIAETAGEFVELVAREASASNTSAEAYRRSLAGAVAGTPEQCAEAIQRYVDSGISYFFLLFPDPIPTESLELFARKVMPYFE